MFESFGGKTKSFWIDLQVWQVFVSKVMKFWSKHFLTIMMGNNNKMTENDVGEGLGTKPNHLGLIFNFSRFLCQKSWNFDRNVFKLYWWKTIRNWPKRKCMFLVPSQVIFAWFSTLSALIIFVPESVMEFWLEVFLALFYVKQQIDLKKWCFQVLVQNQVIWLDLKVWWVFVSKVMKFWQ